MNKKNDLNSVFTSVQEGTELAKKYAENGNVDIVRVALKVSEETGELAAEVLKLVGHKNSDETRAEIIKKIKSEGVDVLLAVLDVVNSVGITQSEIVTLSEKALTKWKKKHLKTKKKKIT